MPIQVVEILSRMNIKQQKQPAGEKKEKEKVK